MKQHIIPSIIASMVASGAAIGFVHVEHTPVVNIVKAPASQKPITLARAASIAKRVWPEMEQSNVDKLTAAVKNLSEPHRITIFCANDNVCGDLALNLDNSFESAHWQSDVVNFTDARPGISTDSKELLAALIAAGLDAKFDDTGLRVINGVMISIGYRYVP